MSKKSILNLFAIFVALVFGASLYIYYIQEHKENLKQEIYQNEAHFIQKNVATMIEEKKKTTTAIALTLATNDAFQNLLQNPKELHYKFSKLILDFKKYTNYQNVWIHILDKQGQTLYRSWIMVNDDSLCAKRSDIKYVIEHKKILTDVSMDIFTLNIKSIVPLYDKEHRFIGLIEVISHFNSISKGLKKLGIDSVVVVNEKMSKQIRYPFTGIYIQRCYIANFDVPQKLREYLKNNNIKQFCCSCVKIADDYIIASYPLKDYDDKIIAYYIMFKKLSAVSTIGLDFFVFRWSMFAIVVVLLLVSTIYYFIFKKQKTYYKNILNTSNNIVLINDKKRIIDANKTFFKYFTKYKHIEEFLEENNCVCNFFVDEEGYLHKGEAPYHWLDSILQNPKKIHKVKMEIENQIYYFTVYVSFASREKNHFSVIFSDITEQEIYKKELEKLSLHDALTNAGNRRKFEEKLHKEVARVCRYKHPLSLIFFDIDHFKEVNDKHGHVVGDEVLSEYTQLVASLLRDVDEIFRIGGEEFVIIAPHITKEAALALAEKLRKAIEAHKKIVPITASFGVTEFKVCENEKSFYKRADDALYAAKKNGRNRVIAK